MNLELKNVIKLYFIKKNEFKEGLANLDKEKLIEIIYEIFVIKRRRK